jgi:hypothetical protein
MQARSIKKIIFAGGALVVLGLAAVGGTVALAQSTTTPAPNGQQQNIRDRYTQALANHLGITVDKLKQAMQDARTDVGLPAPGTRPAPGARPAPGTQPAPGARTGPGFGRGPFGAGFLGAEADAVAKRLGLADRAALLNEVQGKTLAEVASAHNVSTQALVDTITKTANDRIDKMAQARNLSADQVNQLKQRISERVQEFVTTHRFPARGSGVRS